MDIKRGLGAAGRMAGSLLIFGFLIVCPAILSANPEDPAPGGTRKGRPNIIFILVDDLGWGELGCYGNDFNETPNLDRMAAEGLRFTQAYAAAPVCSPTRASLMTGQYPARIRITDFLPARAERYLDTSYLTLNEVLSSGGYRTCLVGKWHLDTRFDQPRGAPDQHGFDEVIGSETKYIADGDYFFPYDKVAGFSTGDPEEYLTTRQSREACAFIERNKEQPFFLYLSYYSVHSRLDAPEALVDKYRRKFDAKYGAGAARRIFKKDNPRHEANHRDNPYLAAMLESIDEGVGDVLRTLKENGLEENTVVIFFSDNGGAGRIANNGGLKAGKTWLYEGGIRVPFLMWQPGTLKPGRVVEEPVSSVDFYPTFARLAGLALPAGQQIDGISLLPCMKGGRLKREFLFWHYPSETGKWTRRMASAVRQGAFKLLEFHEDGRLELYNLEKDPGERHNLAAALPGKLASMKRLLDKLKQETAAEQIAGAAAGRKKE